VRASGNGPQPPARYGQNDRAIAPGRRAWLFAGSDRGGERAAAMYTLLLRQSSTVSIHRPGLAMYCVASPIIRPPSYTSCCPGTGSYAKPEPLPPDNQPIAAFAGCLLSVRIRCLFTNTVPTGLAVAPGGPRRITASSGWSTRPRGSTGLIASNCGGAT
jgi:hypothetical protein